MFLAEKSIDFAGCVRVGAIVFLMLGYSCSPGLVDVGCEERIGTKVAGIAVMNTSGGTVEARTLHDGSLLGSSVTGEIGDYKLSLKSFSGDLIVKACGGSYVDMVTGVRTEVGDECFHALVNDVKVCEAREVHINPFSEILHAYYKGQGKDSAEALATNLKDWLGTQDVTTRASVFCSPKIFDEHSDREMSPQVMSYLLLGGFSRLASDLVRRLDGQAETRISAVRLTKIITESISGRDQDGKRMGEGLMIDHRKIVPSTLLRQEFAQAIIRFCKSDSNKSMISWCSITESLARISQDTFPALGMGGETLDLDAPDISISGVAEGEIVVSDSVISCRATDATGVSSIQLKVVGAVRDEIIAQSNDESCRTCGRCENVSVDFNISNLATGMYKAICYAADPWGNASLAERSFSINVGNVAPEIYVEPPAVDEENQIVGTRNIRCVFNDPHVVETWVSVEREPQADTSTIEFRRSLGQREVSHVWDSTSQLDGKYKITCFGITRGHEQPRTKTMQVRVKNKSLGFARGHIFPGAKVSGLEITAFSWGREGVGCQISDVGRVSDENGSFVVSLTNEYVGPFMLEARIREDAPVPRIGSITALADCREMGRNFKLRVLVDSYRPGQVVDGLVLNSGGTLAAELALATQSRYPEENPVEVIRDCTHRIEKYISPEHRLDIVRQPAPDMTRLVDSYVLRPERMALGFFHAGMEAMVVMPNSGAPHTTGWPIVQDMLEYLRERIVERRENASAQGNSVCRVEFDEEASRVLRSNMAQAIYRWVGCAAQENYIINRTGINRDHRGLVDWLRQIGASDESIFGGHPTIGFDCAGPEIQIACLSDGTVVDCGQTFRKELVLRVQSQHVAGVESTDVYFGGVRQGESGGICAEGKYYDISVEDGFSGEREVVIQSTDGFGNIKINRNVLRFDQTPVAVAADRDSLQFLPSGRYDVEFDTSREIVRISIRSAVHHDQEWRPKDGFIPLRHEQINIEPTRRPRVLLDTGGNCGYYQFLVEFQDELGNKGEWFITIEEGTANGSFRLVSFLPEKWSD